MLKWWLRRQLAAFEKAFDYDASYMHELLDSDTSAFLKIRGIHALGAYRKGVPKDAWHTVGLVATMSEDCGPCTQIGVRMAEADGVAPEALRSVLTRDVAAMPPDVALAYRFAQAAIDHDPDADGPRGEVLRRWGMPGLISLSFSLTAARCYPTLKYALGHGQACVRVQVAGTPVPVLRPVT